MAIKPQVFWVFYPSQRKNNFLSYKEQEPTQLRTFETKTKPPFDVNEIASGQHLWHFLKKPDSSE